MDTDSKQNYAALAENAVEHGIKDQHLNKMMMFDKEDRMRQSETNFDQQFAQYGSGYHFDANVYNKDVNSDYTQRAQTASSAAWNKPGAVESVHKSNPPTSS
jgi:hypothetical protein